MTLNLSLGCAPFKIWVKQIDMKQTLEEAVNEIGGVHPDWDKITCFRIGFKEGARWQTKQAIEILSSVLENWVHGGDADCIIAEFEEKLNNM